MAGSAEWVSGSAVKLGILQKFCRSFGQNQIVGAKIRRNMNGIVFRILMELNEELLADVFVEMLMELSS